MLYDPVVVFTDLVDIVILLPCILLSTFKYLVVITVSNVLVFPSYALYLNASVGIDIVLVTDFSKPVFFLTLFAITVPVDISNCPVYFFHVVPLSTL
ncbi:hypothetical protein D3C73_574550 [compost metagenome]